MSLQQHRRPSGRTTQESSNQNTDSACILLPPDLTPIHRRSIPKSVAPTTRSLRDSMLGTVEEHLSDKNSLYYGSFNETKENEEHDDQDRSLLDGFDDELGKLRAEEVSERESGSVQKAAAPSPYIQHRPQYLSFGNDSNRSSTDGGRTTSNFLQHQPLLHKKWQVVEQAASQIPAILLVTLFHLMVGIPFGVSYFPVGWKSASSYGTTPTESTDGNGSSTPDEDDHVFLLDGPFPLPGKESLGIRMFLFSTIIGQLVMTYSSNFHNCIALQMVENVPFCQSLSYIVIQVQGYGKEALSTLFFLFGLASVIVGVVFYVLGRMELGRILYFFPAHVLVGCIGGIGVFIAKTGLEVTANTSFSLNYSGFVAFVDKIHLLAVVFGFEIGLRLLSHLTKDASGTPRYPLLSPIYFCLITPLFYLGIWLSGNSVDSALDAGYFFPPLSDCSGSDCNGGFSFVSSVLDVSVWNIFHMVDFTTISWAAVFKSIPTLMALVMFSLIHVPINIPAFAVSTDVDVDMNKELMAHGYSNGLVGLLGGLQNYMAYTQSIIYYKSGGKGRASSLAVAFSTTLLFFIGPAIASYMPRCMAGTLLLHCGIDLFLEGVYDSFGRYDYLEYTGVWSITIIMTLFGMEAALIMGVISALSTYAIQSVTYPKPIRGSMTAATLRSSAWDRSPEAFAILDSYATGRIKIFVIQLQGHLFFGNISLFSDGVKKLIQHQPIKERPYIIIMDFSLVMGIDSSAAQAIIKLRDALSKHFGIKFTIFVSGSPAGFPCEFDLSEGLNTLKNCVIDEVNKIPSSVNDVHGRPLVFGSSSHVCDDLDQALVYAEDVLIAMVNPKLLNDNVTQCPLSNGNKEKVDNLNDEKEYAASLVLRKVRGGDQQIVEKFLTYFSREVYSNGDILWQQGALSDCAKLLICGDLISKLENEAGTTETISIGSFIGESALVQNTNRNSTVHVLADNTVMYSLSRKSWNEMKENDPKCAHLLYDIVVQYLTLRVQHVSNRIFETRCLPI